MSMFEDTSQMRHFNEILINQQDQNNALLRKCLKESEERTNKMINILNNIEAQLFSIFKF